MIPERMVRKRTSSSSAEALLKHYTAIYDAMAFEYHLARFGDRPGRYDLEETRALIKDIVSALQLRHSNDWLALDLACGTGKIATALAQAGGRIVALDAAIGMLQQCSANSKESGVEDNLISTNASAGNLPYRDNSFDIVVSFRFLHLLPVEAYSNLIREMVRVVKPGGYIIVEMKNRWYGVAVYWVKDLFRALKGEDMFSSYVSIKQLHVLAQQIGEVTLQSTTGLLLPKGWWLAKHPHLAQIARGLARGPLKSISAHLVAAYQKDQCKDYLVAKPVIHFRGMNGGKHF